MIGAIVHVETQLAGANLAGDHAAGATTLNVIYGWDFPAGGGQLSIAGAVYDYTAATYPLESDDDPTVLTLAEPLASAAADGEFVKVEPEAADKFAEVKLGEYGETIVARVAQPLIDKIRTGVRGDLAAAETVIVEPDGNSWVLQDVVGRQLPTDPRGLDTTVELPPQMIPAESWQHYAALYGDYLVYTRIQGDVAVVGSLTIAKYSTNEAGETTPDPESGIIEADPDLGLRFKWPTGQFDGDGEPLYQLGTEFRTIPQLEAGELLYQVIRGGADLDFARVQRLAIEGSTAEGKGGSVASGSELVLNSVVDAPTTAPSVSFGVKTQKWPALSDSHVELGFGRNGSSIVTGRYDADKLLQARVISAAGELDRDQDIQYFASVAGFTADAGKVYVLGKFLASESWAIRRFDLSNGWYDGAIVNVSIDSASTAALGILDDGRVALLGLGGANPTVRVYGTGLSLQETWTLTGLTSAQRDKYAIGVGTGFAAMGDMIVELTGSGTTKTTHTPDESTGGGMWSRCGRMTGCGKLSSGQIVATNQTGVLFKYNNMGQNDNAVILFTTADRRQTTPSLKRTLMGPVAELPWPAGMWATIQGPDLIGNTNDIGLYAGTSAARTSQRLLPKTVGDIQVTIAGLPASGANPVATTEFSEDGSSSARLRTTSLIPGTSRPAALIQGTHAELYGLSLPSVKRQSTQAQSIPTGDAGETKIDWNVEGKVSTDLPYNSLTREWTANLAGKYLIHAHCGWNAGASTNGYRMLSIFVNGVSVSAGMAPGPTTAGGSGVSDVIDVSPGDAISIRAKQNSGGPISLRALAAENRISIVRLGL